MKEEITITNGFNIVTKVQATFFTDRSKFIYRGNGMQVGYGLYAKVDKRRYPILFGGGDLYIELLGMTKEDWKKYNYKQLVK